MEYLGKYDVSPTFNGNVELFKLKFYLNNSRKIQENYHKKYLTKTRKHNDIHILNSVCFVCTLFSMTKNKRALYTLFLNQEKHVFVVNFQHFGT